MILGLKQGEIKLVAHQDGWGRESQRTQKEIHEVTGLPMDRIEHIGSTAITNIKAKPMIDFAIGVDNISDVPSILFKTLQDICFYRLRVKLEDEIVLARFEDKTFNVKTHIIHLIDYQGKKWNDLILFRDKLNDSRILREEYEAIKLSYLEKETGDMNDYTHFKEAFVKKVIMSN